MYSVPSGNQGRYTLLLQAIVYFGWPSKSQTRYAYGMFITLLEKQTALLSVPFLSFILKNETHKSKLTWFVNLWYSKLLNFTIIYPFSFYSNKSLKKSFPYITSLRVPFFLFLRDSLDWESTVYCLGHVLIFDFLRL